MRKKQIELSTKLRYETLAELLTAKDLDSIAMSLGVKLKALKYRVTLIYKFYGVKNRTELMAMYVNIPYQIRKILRKNNTPVKRRTSYRSGEQFRLESKNNEILPFGKILLDNEK